MAELIDRPAPSDTPATIMAGGISLVVGALAFIGVFSFLADRFNYPAVLDGSAADVLPALLATGDWGRGTWALYGVLPLALLPASIATFCALRDRAAGIARVAGVFAVVAAISLMLGLMRWPSVQWELARAWAGAGESDRRVLAAIFDGLNSYLGNFIGEFLGELCLSIYFALSGIGILRHRQAPHWLGWGGILTGVLGLIGMWRNVAGTLEINVVAGVNNYLLPVWMIAFGIWLIITARRIYSVRS